MCNNPEYGVCLNRDAVEALYEAYPQLRPRPARKPCQRKKTNRLSVRLGDDDYKRFCTAFEASGEKSVQDYLEKIIGRAVSG